MDQESIIILVNRIKANENTPDSAAEAVFLKIYLPQIKFKINIRLNHTTDTVDDLIQDVVFDLVISLRKGNFDPGKATLSSYINGIVNHRLSRFFSEKKQKKIMPLDDTLQDILRHEPDVEGTLDRQQLIDCLRNNLPKLRKNYREVFILLYHDQLSIQEAAKKLGRSSLTISNEKFQAIQTLKKKYLTK